MDTVLVSDMCVANNFSSLWILFIFKTVFQRAEVFNIDHIQFIVYIFFLEIFV